MSYDSPGTILAGKYELLKFAGRGGMAVVWRARTLGAAGFSRPVAVKRINPHLASDPDFVEMFVEEARVVSELQHPLIAQIHDFGVDDMGMHFLVMEWVEGIDFDKMVQGFLADGGVVPWPLVAAIGIEMLGALGAAHEHRSADARRAPIIHRDVTPSNVLLSVDGFVKLTDFGIAKAMDRTIQKTQANALKGKASYLAPELVRGVSASVQSDLFGVGICLWEALAGRRLFDGDTDIQVIMKVGDCEIPDLRTERPDVPEELWDVLALALAKDPSQRCSSSNFMARLLRHTLRLSSEPTDHRRLAACVRDSRERLGVRAYSAVSHREVTEILD